VAGLVGNGHSAVPGNDFRCVANGRRQPKVLSGLRAGDPRANGQGTRRKIPRPAEEGRRHAKLPRIARQLHPGRRRVGRSRIHAVHPVVNCGSGPPASMYLRRAGGSLKCGARRRHRHSFLTVPVAWPNGCAFHGRTKNHATPIAIRSRVSAQKLAVCRGFWRGVWRFQMKYRFRISITPRV